jgi:hypothetical protein
VVAGSIPAGRIAGRMTGPSVFLEVSVSHVNAFLTRPRVAELVFQVYGRPLHPELFDILAHRRVEHEGAVIHVRITRTGHVVSWENADVLVTEIADIDQQFSDKRRLMHFRMRGEHVCSLECGHGITYQTSFQVETMTPETFQHFHDEIAADGEKNGLIHHFHTNQRWSLSPLGFMKVEAKPRCLLVSAFHTFPDEYTVVKSQTLVERR